MKRTETEELKKPERIKIRNEKEADYRQVEEMTRKAFWNLYVPGCTEHYLVHVMRGHEDFLPELDFLIEIDDEIVGNIMYTKAKLVDEAGEEKEILTFGPVSILPEYQRMGLGKMLINHSMEKAADLGYDVIVIFGNPGNYVTQGFQSGQRYQVCIENGMYPSAMMVKMLKPDALDERKRFYHDSPVMHFDEQEALRFDESLEPMEKKHQPSQEEFYIHSHSFINEDSFVE